MDITYWNKDIETMDRSAIEALQLKRLRELVDQSLKTEFYKRRLSKAGITSSGDIQTLDDLRRLPSRRIGTEPLVQQISISVFIFSFFPHKLTFANITALFSFTMTFFKQKLESFICL